MPEFTRLSEDEAKRFRPVTHRESIAPYIAYLTEVAPGEFGKLTLEPEDKKPTVKNRLTRAAKMLGNAVSVPVVEAIAKRLPM